MFTGCIETTAVVKKFLLKENSAVLTLMSSTLMAHPSSSIAVNGVCLTVNKVNGDLYDFDILLSTLDSTQLSLLKPGDVVNIEKALKMGEPLDGHLVLGHVDFKAEILKVEKLSDDHVYITIKIPTSFLKYFPLKASLTVQGVSLTIQKVLRNSVTVEIVPYTFKNTNLGLIQKGDIVNIEIDSIARYLNQLLRSYE